LLFYKGQSIDYSGCYRINIICYSIHTFYCRSDRDGQTGTRLDPSFVGMTGDWVTNSRNQKMQIVRISFPRFSTFTKHLSCHPDEGGISWKKSLQLPAALIQFTSNSFNLFLASSFSGFSKSVFL
jgi:hypothetical protein